MIIYPCEYTGKSEVSGILKRAQVGTPRWSGIAIFFPRPGNRYVVQYSGNDGFEPTTTMYQCQLRGDYPLVKHTESFGYRETNLPNMSIAQLSLVNIICNNHLLQLGHFLSEQENVIFFIYSLTSLLFKETHSRIFNDFWIFKMHEILSISICTYIL